MRSGRRLSTTSRISSAPVAPLLADVDGDTEPCRARRLDHRCDLGVVVAEPARARARDVDADDAPLRPRDRLLDDDRVLPLVERAVHHQDQARPHMGVLEAGPVETANRRQDDVIEIALAAAVALHRVEPQLECRDPLRAVRASDGTVDGALDGERRGLDQLRPVIDRVERIEVLDAARVRDRDEPVELPEVLDGQRDALLVGETPQNVRRDGAAEVGMELGETVPRPCAELTVTRPVAPLRRALGARRRAGRAGTPGRSCAGAGIRGRGDRRPPASRRRRASAPELRRDDGVLACRARSRSGSPRARRGRAPNPSTSGMKPESAMIAGGPRPARAEAERPAHRGALREASEHDPVDRHGQPVEERRLPARTSRRTSPGRASGCLASRYQWAPPGGSARGARGVIPSRRRSGSSASRRG